LDVSEFVCGGPIEAFGRLVINEYKTLHLSEEQISYSMYDLVNKVTTEYDHDLGSTLTTSYL
jgi:hypothetical protein